jgi:hypothetical protein
MMGGALGLAVLASLAAARSGAGSASDLAALNDGYRLAFGVGALCAVLAAAVGTVLIPVRARGEAERSGSGSAAASSAEAP